MPAPISCLADILKPLSERVFFDDYHDRRPLHVPAERDDKFATVMSWALLTECLNMTAVWRDATLRMVLDREPVPTAAYCRQAVGADGQSGWQPDADKVKALLRRGASLIANDIDTLRPGMAAVADALEAALGGKAQSNLYCSWEQHQAFDVHFDTHEVFVLHAEGEKRWRVYANRSDQPIAHPAFKSIPQAVHNQRKGEVLLEVVLRPGDLLYIPRGFYHDAMAESPGTVHVSFGITHVIGMDVVNLLLDHLVADPLFRMNLPLPRVGEAVLRTHLRALADRLGTIAAGDVLLRDVHGFRRDFRYPRGGFDLPGDALTDRYNVTASDLVVVARDGRQILRSAKGAVPIPAGREALVSWIVARGNFTKAEVDAHFPDVPADTRASTLADLHRMKVIARA